MPASVTTWSCLGCFVPRPESNRVRQSGSLRRPDPAAALRELRGLVRRCTAWLPGVSPEDRHSPPCCAAPAGFWWAGAPPVSPSCHATCRRPRRSAERFPSPGWPRSPGTAFSGFRCVPLGGLEPPRPVARALPFGPRVARGLRPPKRAVHLVSPSRPHQPVNPPHPLVTSAEPGPAKRCTTVARTHRAPDCIRESRLEASGSYMVRAGRTCNPALAHLWDRTRSPWRNSPAGRISIASWQAPHLSASRRIPW